MKKYNNLNEDEILEILYTGNKDEIRDVLCEYEIKYHFSKYIEEYSIYLKKLDICIRGKGVKNPDYNCIKFFGYNYDYK